MTPNTGGRSHGIYGCGLELYRYLDLPVFTGILSECVWIDLLCASGLWQESS